GESFENNDLTLKTYGTGDLVFDLPGGVTLMQAQAWDLANGSTSALNVEGGLLNLDTQNARVGIGTTGPDAKADILSTTEQLRLTYTDGSVYNSFTVNSGGDLTIAPSGGDVNVSGNISAGVNSVFASTFDAVGASALTIGSADVTSVTVTTDGTGNAEVVLPTGSIGSGEVLDDTLLEVDLAASNSASNGQCLTYNNGTGGFTWTNCDTGGASAFTDGGTIVYLTDTTDDFAIGGSTLAAAFSVDTSANTTRIGTGATANAILSMYASNGSTGDVTYTTNDSWNFSGGSVGINTTGPDAQLDVLATTEQLRLTYTDGSVYNSFTVNSGGDLTIAPSGGDVNVSGNISAGSNSVFASTFDAVGASSLTIGSADVTSVTVTTDGTGTAEVVLPAGSIDSTEILDATILATDLKSVDSAADEECLTRETTTGDFEWQACSNAANIWTDGTGISYLTDTVEDFAVGGSTLASAFSVDVSANTARIGTGATVNAVLSMFASDGDTGTITYTTNDEWSFSGGNILASSSTITASDFICTDCLDFSELEDTLDLDAALVVNQGTNTWTQSFTGTTTNGLTYASNSLTTGTAYTFGSTSTALTSGSIMNVNWTPGSATTASGDLFGITIGSNGTTTGNLFVVRDGTTDLFTITESGITSNLPQSFTSPGDVSLSYDLIFANQVSSQIRTNGPFTIEAGESFENNDLTLKTYGTGDLVFDLPGGVTLMQAQAWDLANGSTSALNVEGGLLNLDTQNARVGIGTTGPDAKADILSTTEQLRLTYTDGSVYNSFTVNSGGDLTIAPSGGDVNVSGNISAGVNSVFASTFDAVGASALTIGSADVTSVTVTTDGTGNAEVVLPTGSIGSGEVLDDTLLEVDLAASNSASNGQCLTYNNGTGGFTWTNCDTGGASAFTDGGTIVYLTDTTDDFAIGGSTLAAAFSVDTSANTTRIGTGATANAILSMYASNGSTGDVTYTTNDSWNFSGGSVGINTTGPDAQLDVLATTEQLRLTYTDGSVYNSFTVNSGGDLTIAPSGGDVNVSGNISAGSNSVFASTFDAVGASSLTIGSADVTSVTVTTDGTGTAEVVLPAGSIDSTEILDATILATDLKSVDSAADEECLTRETTTGDFEWQACSNAANIWTDGTGISYLTDTVEDFAVGGSTLASAFSVDVSANTARIGTGATVNAVLSMFASDGDTGTITYTTNDEWSFSGGNILASSSTITASDFICTDCLDFSELEDTLDLDAALVVNQGTNTWTQSFTGTTTNGLTYASNSLTTGTAYTFGSTSTALTSGSIMNVNWTPGSATTASGDLFGITIGSNGTTTGNLFVVRDGTTDLFTITESGITSNLPQSFTSPGDVSLSYDLIFANQVSSQIRTNGPFTIEAGESFENNDLTLKTYGTGDLVFDLPGGVTLMQAQAWDLANGSTNALNVEGGLLNLDTQNARVGIGTTGPDAKADILSTTEQLRLTYTDGSVYNSFTVNSGGDLTIAPSGGDVNVSGNISAGANSVFASTFDAVGASALTIGSADVTSVTVTTDGTGTAEVVLPAGSIDSTEILDATILATDLKSVDTAADEECLTRETTTGDFEWQTCGDGVGPWTDGSGITYLTDTAEDLAVGGSTLASAFSVDVSANTARLGTGATANAILSMYASDGDTGTITYTTNDEWSFSGGNILASSSTITASDFICTDCLDFTELIDAMTLDASTGITMGANNLTFTASGAGNITTNLSSTGDFIVQDNGTTVLTVNDSGNTVWSLPVANYLQIDGATNDSTTTAGVIDMDVDSSTTGNIGIALDYQDTNTGTAKTFYAFRTDVTIDANATGDDTVYGNYLGLTQNDANATAYGFYVTGEDRNYMSGTVGIGTTGPDAKLDVLSTTEQLRLTYTDGSVYNSFTVNSGGDLTIAPSGGDVNVSGNISAGSNSVFASTFDAVGASALTIGSADVTSVTVTTDGTGTAEVVLPAGSIDSTEILDATILATDLKSVDTAADEECLTRETTTGDFEWQPCSNAANIWTDGTGISYLTDTAEDLAIGGSTLASPFSVDVSANTVRFGTGATANAVLSMFASDGDTGNITYTTNDEWSFTGGNILASSSTVTASDFICTDCIDFSELEDTLDLDAALVVNQGTNTWTQNFTGTTTNGLTYASNSLTTGTAYTFGSTSTALTSGSIMDVNWTPGSATTATGDLFGITIGSNGTTSGNLFVVRDGTTPLFAISETGITSNLPHSFTAAGDVSMAYDLQFTNQTSSTIKTKSPLYLEVGDNFESNNLTLKTYNSGDVVFDAPGGVTLLQAQAWDLADSSTTSLNVENGLLVADTTNSRIGIGTTGADAKADILATTEQLRLTYTDGSVYNSFTVNSGGDLTIAPSGGDVNVSGNISAGSNSVFASTFDAVGASALTIGSADVTSVTVTTNGTGDSEVVLPTGSISAGEILDDTLLPVDMASVDSEADEECLTYESTGSTFEWQTCGGASSPWTDGTGITYLTDTAEDFAVGGSTLASAFSVDVSANTARIGTGATANAVLSMFASDGDTGTITYTTNDEWSFSGGNILASSSTITASDFVCTDCLDFTELIDAMTLDASTGITMGANNLTFTASGAGNVTTNLSSTGDFIVQDNGTTVLTVNDSGNTVWSLPAANYLQIDAAATDTTTTAGVIDVNIDSSTGNAIGFSVDFEDTNTGSTRTMYAIRNDITIDANATGNDNVYGYYSAFTQTDAAATAWGIYSTGEDSNYFSANVGIGTSGPDRRLDVLDASAAQLRLTYTDGSVYSEFQTDSSGNLTVSTTGSSVTFSGDTVNATDFACTDCLDFAELEDTLDLDAALVVNQGSNTWTQNFTGTTTNGLTYASNSLTTGTAYTFGSSSTALTTGTVMNVNWTPGSATTATGDVFAVTVGSNGNVGNVFIARDGTSSLFSITETAITSELPHSFNAAGDVAIAYDMLFSNQTAAYIKSNGPFTIEAGESFESNDLTMRTFNSGGIILEAAGNVSINNDLVLSSDQTLTSTNIGGSGILAYGAICADDSLDTADDCIDASRAAGTVYGISSSFAIDDIAENFPTLDESIQAGDLVSIDPQTVPDAVPGAFQSGDYETEFVKKANSRSAVLGAISEKPGVLLGGFGQSNDPRSKKEVAVALNGRIPVNVVSTAGNIEVGDPISGSDVIGFGQKAIDAGWVIGRALSPFDPNNGVGEPIACPKGAPSGSRCAQILVMIQAGWYQPSAFSGAANDLATLLETSATLKMNSVELTNAAISDSLTVLGKATVGELVVNKNITNGMLTINGENGSLETVASSLKLQPTRAASLDIMGGAVEVDIDGNLKIKEGLIYANDSIRGSIALPAGQVRIPVVKDWKEAPKSINTTPSYNTKVWVESITKDGFVIYVESASATDATIYWSAIW
ncbi:hypothetical protein HGA91_06575, partial [candidate division WWE3 bacterium]|nr:hypothetical protein [candidate division WWE3 bacterium]